MIPVDTLAKLQCYSKLPQQSDPLFGEGTKSYASFKLLYCTMNKLYSLWFISQVFDDEDAAAVQEAITTFFLGIFVVSKARDGLPEQAGIAIVRAEVLFGIPDGTCLHLSDGPFLCLGTKVP